MLGLDLVPRVQSEPVNLNTLSPVALYLLHQRSTASTTASSVRQVATYHLEDVSGLAGFDVGFCAILSRQLLRCR